MCNEDAERLRAERNAKRRAHYLANREKVLARTKAYKAANREKHWLTSGLPRGEQEQRKAANKAYHAANREKRLAYMAAYRPPAVPPGSSPDERRLPFPPAAAAARLHRAGPDLRPLAGLDRIHDPARPLRRRCRRRPPCASGTAPATSTAARTSPATTVAPLGHTGLAVLHALIFDFLNHRTGRLDPSYAAIAAKAGVCVRTVATRAAAAEGARDPELGAPLRRALGRRPVRARAGDQRLRRAAGEPVARLPAASRSRQDRLQARGAIHRPCCQRSPRRRWRAIWRARCRRWPADPKDGLAAALARLGRAFMARNA